ncbi:MAG: alkaline phosphatase family protein [Candidatus Eisenbacteria bacterium]|nr:alkaline phosphatase family protein [Candidatus Eisenbacteria bacterium]
MIRRRWALVGLVTLAFGGFALGCRGERGAAADSGLKVVILGLDAATWQIAEPLARSGRLPNFRRLLEEGATGIMVASEPTWSPAVWTSIATGVSRARHGITDFVTTNREGDRVPFTANQRKRLAIWNILSDAERTVGVVNWWVSYPAEPVNGFMVSNYWRYFYHRMLAGTVTDGQLLEGLSEAVYPREIAREIAVAAAEIGTPWDIVDRHAIETHEVDGVVDPAFGMEFRHDAAIFRHILERDELVRAAAMRLYRQRHPDFFAAYFEGIDAACHLYWPFAHPDEYPVDPAAARDLGGVIHDCYELADRVLGDYMSLADSATVVVVCSDHGYGSLGGGRHFHVPQGLIAFWGAPVRRGIRLADMRDEDITPTILGVMGYPRAKDMDGKTAGGILADLYADRLPGREVATYERAGNRDTEPMVSPIDDDVISQLEALGYLEAARPRGESGARRRSAPRASRGN